VAVGARQDVGDLPRVGQPLSLRLADQALEPGVAELRRDLKQHTGWCRGADAVQARDIAPMQRAGAVKADARPRAMAGACDAHVDRAPIPAHEPCQRRRRPPAEAGIVAAGEDGGHELTVQRLAWVPDRVDAGVEAVQLSLANAPRDCVLVQAAPAQLIVADAAVLACRDMRDPHIGRRGEFVAAGTTHPPHPDHRIRISSIASA